MTKIKKGLVIAAGVMFIALAVIFFFYDLEISKAIVQDSPNIVFRLIEAIGEFPIYIGPVLFALVYGFTSEGKRAKLIFHMLGLIIINIASIRLASGVFEEFYNNSLNVIQYSLLAIASLLVYILLFILFSKINEDKLISIRDLTLLGMIVSIASFCLVVGLKYIWGRPRYWALDGNYDEFTNYLTINGFSSSFLGNENLSFPSGHTNSASCIILIPFLIERLTNKKWIKIVSIISCLAYILLVAVSRVFIGAHYASDVLFGFALNCACFTICYIVLKKRGWLHVRSNKC